VDDAAVVERFVAYRASGDRRLRNELVEAHRWIAVTCARKFRGRGELIEDLVQVAMLGLVKAVERFDPTSGTPFVAFAMPTVSGELRRYFRDATWAVYVPRRMKELAAQVAPAVERLRGTLGRQPTLPEIANELRVRVDDVIGALEASSAYRSTTLPSERSDDAPARERAVTDGQLADADARLSVRRLLGTLSEREKTILYLRFFRDRSQAEIAEVVGTSQAHVSRLIRSSLVSLREHVTEDDLAPQGTDVPVSHGP
jgi:RNA polymerase sigma-B factor